MNPTLTAPSALFVSLPEENKRAWQAEASQLAYSADWRAFVQQSTALAKRYLTTALGDFFNQPGVDVITISNLPVDANLPATPTNGRRPAGKSAVSEAVIAGLIEPFETIFSYTNEKDGAPIHEIAPVAGLEATVSSAGRVPFLYHTDAAFLEPDLAPKGLILMGLRNTCGGPTAVLPLDHFLDAAPAALLRKLEQPVYRHPSPVSFGELGIAYRPRPILWRDEFDRPSIAVQTHAVEGIDDEARATVAEFRQLLATVTPLRVVLSPGNAVIFRNHRVLHGRDAFTGERWLQRAYFTDRIAKLRDASGSGSSEISFDARTLI